VKEEMNFEEKRRDDRIMMKEEWGKSASRRGAWEKTVQDTRGYLDQTVTSELKVIVRGVVGHWALLSHRERTRPLLTKPDGKTGNRS
jgi:hypothetical protein